MDQDSEWNVALALLALVGVLIAVLWAAWRRGYEDALRKVVAANDFARVMESTALRLIAESCKLRSAVRELDELRRRYANVISVLDHHTHLSYTNAKLLKEDLIALSQDWHELQLKASVALEQIDEESRTLDAKVDEYRDANSRN